MLTKLYAGWGCPVRIALSQGQCSLVVGGASGPSDSHPAFEEAHAMRPQCAYSAPTVRRLSTSLEGTTGVFGRFSGCLTSHVLGNSTPCLSPPQPLPPQRSVAIRLLRDLQRIGDAAHQRVRFLARGTLHSSPLLQASHDHDQKTHTRRTEPSNIAHVGAALLQTQAGVGWAAIERGIRPGSRCSVPCSQHSDAIAKVERQPGSYLLPPCNVRAVHWGQQSRIFCVYPVPRWQ